MSDVTSKSTISDDYFSYYNKYTSEYGEKTCILMQIGSFYEMQAVRNEQESIGNLEEVCSILNILVTKKNKGIDTVDRSNPLFAGFPKHSVSKFLPVLLEAGYTVVVIDQEDANINGKRKRVVSGIYSPSIQPLDIIDDKVNLEGNSLTQLLIEVNQTKSGQPNVAYSIANINMTTNVFDLYEGGTDLDNKNLSWESVLDELFRVMIRYNSKEITINVRCDQVPKQLTKDFLTEYLDMYGKAIHWCQLPISEYRDFTRIDYQNKFLRKIYQHVNFGLLQPLEAFGLEMSQLAALNTILTLQFIGKHDSKYVKAIAIPKLVHEYEHLVMEMNTLHQLAIVPNKMNSSSLFQVINKTKTAVGRRGLRALLCKPFKSVAAIESRYHTAEALETFIDKSEWGIESLLADINDFERLHRKMSLGILHPYEFYNLCITYKKINQLAAILTRSEDPRLSNWCLKKTEQAELLAFTESVKRTFQLEELKRYNLMEPAYTIGNFFQKGSSEEIDLIATRIETIEQQVESLRSKYEQAIKPESGTGDWIKTIYTEQEGYAFTCTKIRAQLLQKALSKQEYAELTVKSATSSCKISCEALRKMSLDLVNFREVFAKK